MLRSLPERRAEAQHEDDGKMLAGLVEDSATGTHEVMLATVRAIVSRMGPRFASVVIARLLEDHPAAVLDVRLLRAEPGSGDGAAATLRVRKLYENPPGWDARADSGDLKAWFLRDAYPEVDPGTALDLADAAEILLTAAADRATVAVILGQNELRR